MKRFSTRALALLASLSLTFFAACSGDGDGGGTNPVGTQVRIALAPVFDGPERVPPALDPVGLTARVTDLTEAIEYHDTTFAVEAGTIFEDELDFEVPGGTTQVVLFLELAAADGLVVWAAGPDTIVVPEEGEIGLVTPVFQWVGPGAGAARLELSPDVVALDAGEDTILVVTAFDQAGNPIAGTTAAVDWVSESTELGDFVDQSGRWQSNGTRGEVRVIATLSPQQLSDTSVISIQASAASLFVTGGFEQSAPAGTTLESPVEVQVIATDEEPLAGRVVLFQPQNGGSVAQSAVVTDAEGLARTAWTLGPEVGTQTLRMEVEGRPDLFAELQAEATPVEFQAPTGVSSTPESGGAPPGGIEVAWASDDPNVERFRVERSLDGGISWTLVDGSVAGAARTLVDTGPSGSWGRDQEVVHRVQGCDAQAEGCSGWTVGAEPAYTLPRAPGGLTAEVVETLPTGTVLSVRWTDTNLHETGYDVCDTEAPGGSCTVQQLPAGSESVRFTTSVAADSALITVTARNPGGEAEASVWVQLLTLSDFSIVAVAGDGQSGTVSSGLADPLVIEVRDPFGAAAEGVDVTFTPQDGGTATPASATTDAQGRASTTWTLGSTVGTQTLIAELGAASSVFVEFTAEGAPATIGAPTAVVASPAFVEGAFSGFTVSWASADANVERFRVERRLNGEESWTTVADELASDAREFFDGDDFETDREATYRVQGCDAAASLCSGFGVAEDPVYTPPTAPTGLAAEVAGRTELGVDVVLAWTDTNLFEDGYEICDTQAPGGECELRTVGADAESLAFTTPLADSVLVTVTAVNPSGRASASIWVRLLTLADYSIALVSGDGQSGTVSSALESPVVVEVRDPFDAVAEGVGVTFVAQDGGSATPLSVATGAQGRASTTWTLGPTVGTQTLRAEITEASGVHVVVSATAAPAAISAPTGVEAAPSYDSGSAFDGFNVDWLSGDPNAERFRVQRLLDGEASWTTVADNLPSGARSFFDGDSFQADRAVTYRVQACDAAGSNCSGFTEAANDVYTPPALPTGIGGQILGANANGVVVSATWTDNNSYATRFSVCARALPSDSCVAQAVSPGIETLTFETSAPDSVYITVTASNPTDSASASIWLDLAPPAPTNVSARAQVEEGTLAGFFLSWTIGGPGSSTYEVQRSLTDGETWLPGVDDPFNQYPGQYFDVGTGSWERDREVIYRVRGCNVSACSEWSALSSPVYTLPRAPTGLDILLEAIIEDGPVLRVTWTDTNDFEEGYDLCDTDGVNACDPLDVIELVPNTTEKEFVSIVGPFAESVLVTVTAVNPTGEASASLSIPLPGAGSDALGFSYFPSEPSSYNSPLNWRDVIFENLEDGELMIGTFEESSNVICALDLEGLACTSALGVSFPQPVWSLQVQTGGDEFSGVQGELELQLYDGFEVTFVTVELVGDGNPATVEVHDLSAYGTVVGLTWVPDPEVGLTGFTRFGFLARNGALPRPPTYAPPSNGSGPPARGSSP